MAFNSEPAAAAAEASRHDSSRAPGMFPFRFCYILFYYSCLFRHSRQRTTTMKKCYHHHHHDSYHHHKHHCSVNTCMSNRSRLPAPCFPPPPPCSTTGQWGAQKWRATANEGQQQPTRAHSARGDSSTTHTLPTDSPPLSSLQSFKPYDVSTSCYSVLTLFLI